MRGERRDCSLALFALALKLSLQSRLLAARRRRYLAAGVWERVQRELLPAVEERCAEVATAASAQHVQDAIFRDIAVSAVM